MPPLNYAARRVAAQRSDRRFHIVMGCIFSGVMVVIVAIVWIAVAREPARRAAYMAQCLGTGFSAEQCEFLYAERRRQEADNAAIFAIAAGIAASQAAARR